LDRSAGSTTPQAPAPAPNRQRDFNLIASSPTPLPDHQPQHDAFDLRQAALRRMVSFARCATRYASTPQAAAIFKESATGSGSADKASDLAIAQAIWLFNAARAVPAPPPNPHGRAAVHRSRCDAGRLQLLDPAAASCRGRSLRNHGAGVDPITDRQANLGCCWREPPVGARSSLIARHSRPAGRLMRQLATQSIVVAVACGAGEVRFVALSARTS